MSFCVILRYLCSNLSLSSVISQFFFKFKPIHWLLWIFFENGQIDPNIGLDFWDWKYNLDETVSAFFETTLSNAFFCSQDHGYEYYKYISYTLNTLNGNDKMKHEIGLI